MQAEKDWIKLGIEQHKEYYSKLGIDVEYQHLSHGAGLFVYTQQHSKENLCTDPILLLPGFGNTQEPGGEFRAQIPTLLDLGAQAIYSMHYSYTSEIDINHVIDDIEKIVRDKIVKVSGLSLGADIIVESIKRGVLNSSNTKDVLLLSPYLVAKGNSYGSFVKDLAFFSTSIIPQLTQFLWDNTSVYKPSPTTVLNMSKADLIRKSFTCRYSSDSLSKVPLLSVLWIKNESELGEFASKEMQNDINVLVSKFANNVSIETPFIMEHGEIAQRKYSPHVVSEMAYWYIRDGIPIQDS